MELCLERLESVYNIRITAYRFGLLKMAVSRTRSCQSKKIGQIWCSFTNSLPCFDMAIIICIKQFNSFNRLTIFFEWLLFYFDCIHQRESMSVSETKINAIMILIRLSLSLCVCRICRCCCYCAKIEIY